MAESNSRSVPRRRFLMAAARGLAVAASLPLAPPWAAEGRGLSVPTGSAGQKVRAFPFDRLDSFLVPNESFYLRSHMEIPRIDPAAYRLRLGGWVERSFSLTLSDIGRLPVVRRPVTFECTGSSVGGGMVGTAEWSGPLLAPLLDRAGPKSGALELVMEGSDAGLDEFLPVPLQFARSIPLPLVGEVQPILAVRMNGEPLPPEHGFPVRVILPGLYGVLQVKWLARLTVVREPFRGFYQTQRYVAMQRTEAGTQVREVLRQRVKSQIARVAPLPEKGKGAYRVLGAAWSGGSGIAKVEVSVDGGAGWELAKLESRDPCAWALFTHDWTPSPGKHEIVARATDGKGRSQPLERDPSALTGYVNNWCHRKTLIVPA
jgi:DMSO/TMAO reductase YedYZ molybdopterin-dependent catalytic subunit